MTRRRPGPPPSPIPSHWSDYVDEYAAELRAARRSAGTVALRVSQLRVFAQTTTATPVTVSRAELIAYLGAQDWSPHTAHSMRSTFRGFFACMVQLGHREDDPARALPSVSLPRTKPRPCPDDAVARAMTTLGDRPDVLLALRIGVETGMRRAEIARIRPTDVGGRPSSYTIHVVGKGLHERTIPISDELAALIESVDRAYLFPGVDGGPVSPAHLGKQISRALPGDWTTHTLRHRFATTSYGATRDLRAVQELLGHASPVTTATYAAVPTDAMRTAAAAAAVVIPTDLS